MVEILQSVHEISSFPEVLYKTGDLSNFSKFTDKRKKQSFGGVLSKDNPKTFAKFTESIYARVSFLIKLQAGNLKVSEAVAGDVLLIKTVGDVKKPVSESLFNEVAILRTCKFIKEDFDACIFLRNLQTF